MKLFKILIIFLAFTAGAICWFFISMLTPKHAAQTIEKPKVVVEEPIQHASFAIMNQGKALSFADDKYYNKSPEAYISAEKPSVVTATKTTITWQKFFASLQISIDQNCVKIPDTEQLCTKGQQKLTFYLNGKETPDALSKPIRNGEKLIINYGAQTVQQIEKESEELPHPIGS